jgi:hypothetical protein
MALTKITETPGSGVTAINFTSGIDSTYKVYKFVFLEMNPAASAGGVYFTFQGGAGSYATTMTSTFWKSAHYLDGAASEGADMGLGQHQESGYQKLFQGPGPGATESIAGELYLFNPSSTTFVKHFICVTTGIYGPYLTRGVTNTQVAGYFNVATAITSIGFKLSDDSAFDATIQLWGL